MLNKKGKLVLLFLCETLKLRIILFLVGMDRRNQPTTKKMQLIEELIKYTVS